MKAVCLIGEYFECLKYILNIKDINTCRLGREMEGKKNEREGKGREGKGRMRGKENGREEE